MEKTDSGDPGRKRWRPILIYAGIGAGILACGAWGTGEEGAFFWTAAFYPLACGCLGYLLIRFFASHAEGSEYYRIFSWLYNIGIAILTAGALLGGNTSGSETVPAYFRMTAIAGWTLLAAGIFVLIMAEKESRKGE